MRSIGKSEWISAVLLVLAIKLAAISCLYAGWKFIPRADYNTDLWITRENTSFVDNLANFDGAWFVRLAAIGHKRLAAGDYDLEAETERLRVMDSLGYDQARWPPEPGVDRFDRGYGYRHWPGFVWVISFFHTLGFDPVWAAVLVSNLAALVYGLLMYRLARIDLGVGPSMMAVALSQFHPGSYALSAAYNESLFLLFAAAAMIFARKRAFWLAGFMGMGAAMTRIFGLLLLAPLAYEWLAQREEDRGGRDRLFSVLSPGSIGSGLRGAYQSPTFWWGVLVPAGTFAALFYFYQVAGDAMIWTRVHEQNVHGQVSWPWLMMIETYNKGWHVWMKELPLHLLLLVVVVAGFGKVRGSYWLWMLVFLLFHTSNGNHSYLRYQVQCLPMFIALATISSDRPWLSNGLLCLFAGLSGIFSAMYINGYWVA